MRITALYYTNKHGETMTQLTAYVPLEAKNTARARGLNLSAICSRAIEAAVQEADSGRA